MNIPIYNIVVTDETDTGMFIISLVEEPAVERDFLVFNKEKRYMEYKIVNEEKQKVFGLVMSADKPIYRCDDKGEYYILFTRETIEKMSEKYFKMGFQNNVDTNHNLILEDGITLTQMFIKDTEKGINPNGFEDEKNGSLFAEFHIENKDIWNSIKDGKYKGFSICGTFELSKNEKNELDEILSMLDKLENKLNKIK